MGQMLGQPVANFLRRYGAMDFLVGTAFVGVLGAEIWLQAGNYMSNPYNPEDPKSKWDNTWFEAARSDDGGITSSRLFRVKHGGLLTIMGKQLNPLSLITGGAHNLVSWITDFLTNRSMYDLMVLAIARQALQVCKYMGRATKERACKELMQFLEQARGIASISFSMVGIASTLTTASLGIGREFSAMYGACGFVGGERSIVAMFGGGAREARSIASTLDSLGDNRNLGNQAYDMFRPEAEDSRLSAFNTGDLAGSDFIELSGYARQFKNLGQSSPWLYKTMFGGDRDANNFQLLLLGLQSRMQSGKNVAVGADFWKM